MIAAMGQNRGIGLKGELLWHLPDDLKFFKQQTLGCPIIMGRKTYDSIGKPLPGRRNIVLTRNEDFHSQGVEVFRSLQDAIAACLSSDKIFIAGGAEIYTQALPMADSLVLTHVHHSLEADAFFPEWNPAEFELISELHHEPDERHAYSFTFSHYERKA